jgi:tetratricopeptide (TPR) repeat protein
VWWEKVPFAGLSVLFMGLAVKGRAQAEHVASLQHTGFWARVAQACFGIWFYLVKTVVPSNLTAFYPLPDRLSGVEPLFLLCILGTLGMTLAAVLLRRRWPGLLAAWLAYLVILAPNLGLVQIGRQIAADRYSFISMMGSVVLAAAGLAALLRPGPRGGPVVLGVTAASLAALLGLVVLARVQCRIWRSSEILWSHVLAHGGSQSAMPQLGLGAYLINDGRIDEAMPHLIEALRFAPEDPDVRISLGAALSGQGRTEEAMTHYAAALRLKPNSGRLHYNLAVVLSRQGRTEEARAHYVEAIRQNPDDAESRNNLAAILNSQGKTGEAIAQLTEALRIDPALVDTHYSLGNLLFGQGRVEEAIAQYTEALRLNPRHVGAHHRLGMVLSAQGRIEEALAEYAATLQLDPNDAGVLNNQAMIWSSHPQARYRDGPRAVASAIRACELTGGNDPGFLDTCAAAHAEAGDFPQAVKWQTRAIELLNDASRKEAFRARLKLYQAGQPYREPVRAP